MSSYFEKASTEEGLDELTKARLFAFIERELKDYPPEVTIRRSFVETPDRGDMSGGNAPTRVEVIIKRCIPSHLVMQYRREVHLSMDNCSVSLATGVSRRSEFDDEDITEIHIEMIYRLRVSAWQDDIMYEVRDEEPADMNEDYGEETQYEDEGEDYQDI